MAFLEDGGIPALKKAILAAQRKSADSAPQDVQSVEQSAQEIAPQDQALLSEVTATGALPMKEAQLEYRALSDAYKKQLERAKASVDEERKYAEMLKEKMNAPKGIESADLSGLAMLADVVGGTNLASKYNAPKKEDIEGKYRAALKDVASGEQDILSKQANMELAKIKLVSATSNSQAERDSKLDRLLADNKLGVAAMKGAEVRNLAMDMADTLRGRSMADMKAGIDSGEIAGKLASLFTALKNAGNMGAALSQQEYALVMNQLGGDPTSWEPSMVAKIVLRGGGQNLLNSMERVAAQYNDSTVKIRNKLASAYGEERAKRILDPSLAAPKKMQQQQSGSAPWQKGFSNK